MKSKYAYIAMLLAAACLMTLMAGMVGCGKKGEDVLNTAEPETMPSEPSSEAATEPPTEQQTEPPTEAPTETEQPTEPVTEPPTEPPTEAPTEAEIDFTIKARDTMLEGAPVDFNVGYDYSRNGNVAELDHIKVPIQGGNEIDSKRNVRVCIVNTFDEFEELCAYLFQGDGSGDSNSYKDLPEYKLYNEAFFRENILISIYYKTITEFDNKKGTGISMVKKNGAELCVGVTTRVEQSGDIYPAVVPPLRRIGIEISKAEMDGVDTISIAVQNKN